MIPELSIVGFTLAALGLGVAFVCWRRFIAAQTARERLQIEVNLFDRALRVKAEGIGAESVTALVTYFDTLKAELEEQIRQLEQAQINSATPYIVATEEIQYTRLVDRKNRFIGYRDALLNASVQIEVFIQNLKDDQDFIERLLHRLNSRRWDSAMGNLELEAIEKVITDLKREAIDDLIGGLRLKKAKAEIDHVMRFREAMIAVEKLIRDEETPSPKVSRAARNFSDD